MSKMDNMKDFHIKLEDELLKRLRVYCAERDLRVGEVVAEAIQDKLATAKPAVKPPLAKPVEPEPEPESKPVVQPKESWKAVMDSLQQKSLTVERPKAKVEHDSYSQEVPEYD